MNYFTLQETLMNTYDISASDNISNKTSPTSLTKYALWIEPRDVWCVKLDPIWIEFLGVRSVGQNKAIPFVDAVPITFWIHGKSSIKLNVSILRFDSKFNKFVNLHKNV